MNWNEGQLLSIQAAEVAKLQWTFVIWKKEHNLNVIYLCFNVELAHGMLSKTRQYYQLIVIREQ